MNILREAAIACIVLSALATPARAFEIYRYRMPDGTALYTDEVPARGQLQEIIESPAPDSRQIEEEQRARLKRESARVNRIAMHRVASLDAVETEIHDATQALSDLKAALAAATAPRAGERLGIQGGHSRLSPAYWARVRKLRQAVDDARERLDDAYDERSALG